MKRIILIMLGLTSAMGQELEFRWQGLQGESWQILEQFFDYDKHRPHNGRVVSVEDHRSMYRLERIVYTADDGQRVPAKLAIPKVRKPPYPVVVLLHELGGSAEDWWQQDVAYDGRALSRKLLAAGIAVFTPDARNHGLRLVHNDFEEPDTIALKRGHFNSYRQVVVRTVVDVRRGLDYLRSRDEIDIDRVGAAGYGMGGLISGALTAVDQRVSLMVACAMPIYQQQTSAIGIHNYMTAIGERPMLLLMADRDNTYTSADARNLMKLHKGEAKELVLYDSGHQLPAAYTSRAAAFIKEHLGKKGTFEDQGSAIDQ